jgi:hypothetical protein
MEERMKSIEGAIKSFKENLTTLMKAIKRLINSRKI